MIGGPLGFSLMLSENYRRRGHRFLSATVLALGVLMTGVYVMGPPLAIFAGAFTYSAWFYARRDDASFEAHLASGGAQIGWLKALAIPLGALVLTALIM
jgi:hypothetical protein